ncbi:unnamed protein product [Caenorhabditis angaria]|uniref:Uncharacterized protein n=1 Tax=Caenorhabditis angaria TaxID=860376 RepID=A0A9P1IWY7_9PELO|nr:unnamed protein product [Caenorhabditis angaria]
MSSEYLDKIFEYIEENQDAQNTFLEVLKQVSYGAAGGVAGGILAGPIGGLIGTVTGGIIGYKQAKDYKNAFQLYQNLREDQVQSFTSFVQEKVNGTTFNDFKQWWKATDNQIVFMTALVGLSKAQQLSIKE